jgi:hypothetical protein
MGRRKEDKWKRYLPKGKREQSKIFKKVILYGSSLWRDYVHSESKAMFFMDHQIDLMKRKEIDPKVGFAVILNLADEKLGNSEGVGHLKSVIRKLLEE